jgi:TolA-binding protein
LLGNKEWVNNIFKGGMMSKHRSKDLKHDEFKETIENIIIFYEHHRNTVLWVLGGVAVLLILFFTYKNNKEIKEAKSKEIYNIGVMLYNNGNFDQAMQKFNTVVDNYLGTVFSDRATFMLANISYKKGNLEEALGKFQAFVNGKNDELFTPSAYQGIGQCYEQMGDIEGAIENYQIAVERFQNNSLKSECMMSLARLYLTTQKLDEAENVYKDILKISKEPSVIEEAEKKLKLIQVQLKLNE